MSKLKPFCGAANEEITDHLNGIDCQTCLAHGPTFMDRDEADGWNTRPIEDALRALLRKWLAEWDETEYQGVNETNFLEVVSRTRQAVQ